MSTENKMTYVRLGKSGLKVSKLILGCMSYGTPKWQGWVIEEKESIQHIKFAYENGINTFDTANMYSNGESERILGKAIKELKLPRERIVVLTKLWFTVADSHDEQVAAMSSAQLDAAGYANRRGLSRKHIFESVKASLARLQLDYIDVLQCHRFDPETPIEETMQALHDVVQAGYVRYIGMSSCFAYQFAIMQNYAINNRLTPFISMQNHYNLLYREEEREMMPTLKHFGVGSIPWSPLARGYLTRPIGSTIKTVRDDTDPWKALYTKENNEAVNPVLEKLAKEKNATMAQVALAWIMHKDPVAAPVIGTTSLDKFKDLLGAVSIKLTEEEIKSLEAPYQATAVAGHW